MILLQVAQRVWSPATVHDTVAAVAREAVFRRNLRESIAQRLIMWIGEAIGQLIRFVRHSSAARPIGLGVVALIVVLIVARLLIAARAREDGAATSGPRRGRETADDPFVAAERLAGEGRYEESAHALYRGVLLAIARSDRIRLDPSKTSGDYARELRTRGSGAHQPFRQFARRFDVAVYGHGGCDATLIDDLRRLAAPLVPRANAA